ncbi:MAG TPA: hypothetical protein VGJ55_07005 [Pyrinomonadaceae bacterium]|jgi:hypothetical protein
MKSFTLVLLMSLALLPGSGCKGRNSGVGLDQFVGTWKATHTIADTRGIRISTGTLTVKQPAADTVSLGESSSVVTGVGPFGVPNTETKSFELSLKKVAADKYLLNFKVDSEAVLTDLPLSYSDSDGFQGRQMVTLDGKEQPMTASIKKQGSGYVWKISAEQGSGPKRHYQFELTEKTSGS